MVEPRDLETRRTDTLALLATPAIDVWVATASATGTPYLVPVSLAWVDERAVIAVAGSSVTARNLTASGSARLAVGPTRDVVMIDAVLERSVDVADDEELGAAYVAQADWDPARRHRLRVPRAAAGAGAGLARGERDPRPYAHARRHLADLMETR